MKLLLIDNFDSFTFNLFQLICKTCQHNDLEIESFDVIRNNDAKLLELKSDDCDYIFISPGPGNPDNTGNCSAVLQSLIGKVPFLGICLGHQLIASHFGGRIVHAEKPVHGKVSKIIHRSNGLFKSIPNENSVARYHSLVVQQDSLAREFEIVATSQVENEIMAIAYPNYRLYGFQFHPESFLTDHGSTMIKNFLTLGRLGN